uniref:Kinesin-like protein n=2 Tax=Mucochytrium quahogii TaxID=96639 RepID=A0A7S2RPP3_9STRA|mmetsp:Transcript_25027/g.40602  ORF Transcript_25027/g.40602 Transcript_25027/m.40602 type:complete len:753 (-) Transcript_25027:2070-4328(-)|eukprot:CAMPEP_0203762610 /NCGR_PEP_ID=MMETSP0098-20131031/15456_1 /ASSEMBLY_ACC=CAM_ASM_000208 /TAXON_ID=96639 /ORGANISM=" , Strain NY0313808BC1" /LENGTH=752 /DNA_ID=CAMNT_0050657083 /DNA_START=283 /DNA_END=2541 /DNA_ORIENTATION=-
MDWENIRVCIRFRPVNAREQRISKRLGSVGAKDEDKKVGSPKKSRRSSTAEAGSNEDKPITEETLEDGLKLMNKEMVPWSWDARSVLPLFPITRGERSRQRAIERYGESAQSPVHGEQTEFHFDRVYGIDETTETLYNEVMQELVVSAMEGKHCSAFAFGQTSTGKTYTMQGTSERPGVIPRSVHDVFSYVNQANDREFLLRVAYLEVYNESINDLLNPTSTNLKVFEDKKQGPRIQGLEEKIVVAPEQVFALISAGESQRHIGCTDYNTQSSRSHTIFRIVIESKRKDSAGAARVATLNLVDLAGSEAAPPSQTQTRRKEGSYINKSLLTLTHIIYKLSEIAQRKLNGKTSPTPVHIPYRDSKLTRILQKSLHGNSRISIVCTATPWTGAKEETLNTLRFATRAKKVKHEAHVNEVLDDQALLLKYKQEIALLRRRLADAEKKSMQVATPPTSPQYPGESPLVNSPKLLPVSPTESVDGSGPVKTERMREQIDQAIRNLNRVILNSGLELVDAHPAFNTEHTGGDEEELLVGSEEVETPLTPTKGDRSESLDVSTPFFRRLSSFDEQIQEHQKPLEGADTRLQRSQSQSSITGPGADKPRTSRTKSVSDISDLPKQRQVSPVSSKRKSITAELRSIREQLSTLISAPPQVPKIDGTLGKIVAPRMGSDNGSEYIQTLEKRVEELEQQVRKSDLERSVSKADRSFLEKLLGEKEKTIKEWGTVIQEIETKQLALEQENARLRFLLEQREETS